MKYAPFFAFTYDRVPMRLALERLRLAEIMLLNCYTHPRICNVPGCLFNLPETEIRYFVNYVNSYTLVKHLERERN